MTKLNPTTMKTQYDGQYDTFCRKNHDYGNSFEESLDQFGIIASLVRMQDKMLRLQSLTDESKTQQVGSESLLDTLEDLSNYAAMTACWLRGIRGEDGETSCGPDMIDVIKYNVQDAKNVMSRSAEMEKEFNKHIPSKVENIDPRNYVLNMLSNIFRVVQTKIDKDVMLVPMDISDEAGLIAKAIVESQTEEEGGAVINNYMCTRKDIPYELKDWVYGVIMRHFYYLKKEQAEDDVINKSYHAVKDLIEKCDDSEIIHEPQLPEALYNYIKENVDDCVNRIHQLSLRGSVITKGGLENFTYNLGRVAMDHYEDPQKIIEHIGQIPSFGSLDDKQAQMVKEYIHDFIKEKEAEPINKFVETSSQYNDVEKEIDALLQKLFRMTENRKTYFASIEYLNSWNSIIIEIANIAKTNNISDSHLMDLIFPYTRLESNTILYQVNRNKSSHNDIVVKTDNLEFQNKPVGIWKPLGSEVVHELPYIYKIGDCGVEHTEDNVSHDDTYDFLEKQINCAVGYMNHARAHGKIPLTKDIGIYVHNITQYALEQYINPHRIIQYMDQILAMRSLNPNDALLLCSSVTDCIRNITNKEKGCNRAKARDKVRGVVMKGSRGNSNVIVMASRGSGKAFMKARSLLKELGIPEEDIKEIFEGLEEEDDE